MGRLLSLAGALALAFVLAWTAVQPPQAKPADAPQSEFSAARAMADVQVIARRPHPTGSAANAQVRDHLVTRLRNLGLKTEIQTTEIAQSRVFQGDVMVSGARIENVIGILPGRDRSAAPLLIMSHYDSVPNSPGAADDAAGVAATLEALRALRSSGAPRRDIVVLVTDGEEIGLLGAKAFFERHPLARRVGLVFNLEARGGGGRAQMFETGRHNGQVVELLQRTAVSPSSSSLAVYLYEHMPNGTDFTEALEADKRGLNFAFIGRQFDYHSPTSTAANLDQGSLQDMGDQLLSAMREAAYAEALPQAAASKTYAQVAGNVILAYPPAAGFGVLLLAAALLALGWRRAGKSGPLSWREAARGAVAGLYALLVAAVLLRLARRASGYGFGFIEQRGLLAQTDRWELALVLVALAALLWAAAVAHRGGRIAAALLPLAAGASASLFGGFDVMGLGLGVAAAALGAVVARRAEAKPELWAGLLVLAFIAALALQIAAPPTAFLIAWPLVAGCALAAATGLASRLSRPALVLYALTAGAVTGWLLIFGHGVYLGLDLPEILALFVWLAALVVWPLSAAAPRRLAVAGLAIALLAVLIVRLDPPWTARHPQASHLAYVVAPATGRAYLASTSEQLTPWERRALGQPQRRLLTPWRLPVWSAPAPATPAAPAQVALNGRTLTVSPPPDTLLQTADLVSGELQRIRIAGEAIDVPKGGVVRLRWYGGPLALQLEGAASGAVEIRHAAARSGLPATPARPAEVMPFGLSDVTFATGVARLTW